jgi:uncharacterized membrane protein
VLARRPWLIPLLAWTVLAAPLALVDHYSLRTTAFDLSVFDYALWSALHGRLGDVPFLGHSLFSHHFMPTLLLLVPVYALFPSSTLLILLQLGLAAAEALLLVRLAEGRLPAAVIAGLVAAFLFARPSYNAIMAAFYVESLIPLLIFLMLLAWRRGSWPAYWLALILALGCKEDVSFYVGGFGLLLACRREHRRVGLLTAAVAAGWLAFAVGVAIPASQARDGLPTTNPFLATRYADAGGKDAGQAVSDRLLSWRPLVKLFNVVASVALLPLLAPEYLAVALPGIVLNLSVARQFHQSALLGHYLWPILPWLFVASIEGARRLIGRFPWAGTPVAVLLFAVALGDTPLWLELAHRPWRDHAEAAVARRQLAVVPRDSVVLAQPNLIPHLPHRLGLVALGKEVPGPEPQLVLLSRVGNPWPLDASSVDQRIAQYRADPRFEGLADGPTYVFRRRAAAPETLERDERRRRRKALRGSPAR